MSIMQANVLVLNMASPRFEETGKTIRFDFTGARVPELSNSNSGWYVVPLNPETLQTAASADIRSITNISTTQREIDIRWGNSLSFRVAAITAGFDSEALEEHGWVTASLADFDLFELYEGLVIPRRQLNRASSRINEMIRIAESVTA